MYTFLSRSTIVLKQTIHPPRFIKPLALNPLTRWSSKLPSWHLNLEHQQQQEWLSSTSSSSSSEKCSPKPSVSVGLEGCQCGFNATNAIRTCSFFETTYPPIFMSASCWNDIAYLQRRESEYENNSCNDHFVNRNNGPNNNNNEHIVESLLALFGRETFFNKVNVQGSIVVLENFTDRSVNIFTSRVPSNARIVIGHENNGVSKELIGENERDSSVASTTLNMLSTTFVVYIPQYGTISSLNVVTTLGIALFYVYLDCHFPASRTLVTCHTGHAKQQEAQSTKSETLMTNTKTYSTNSEQMEVVIDSSSVVNNNNVSKICMEENNRYDCERRRLRSKLRDYQLFFESKLPMLVNDSTVNNSISNGNSENRNDSEEGVKKREAESNEMESHLAEERVDKRPIHPAYYCKTSDEISAAHQAYRSDLLKYSKLCNSSSSSKHFADISAHAMALEELQHNEGIAIKHDNQRTERFGISVFYENEYDQRNFGGLIRCANVFLVDHVMYVGRRKYNVVGSLGCYHYTPPVYVNVDYTNSKTGKGVLQEYVETLCGANCQWWFLDCGQKVLYHDKPQSPKDEVYYSSAESWRWYEEHVLAQISKKPNNSNDVSTQVSISKACQIVSLCDKEHEILNAARHVALTNTNTTTNSNDYSDAACTSNSCNCDSFDDCNKCNNEKSDLDTTPNVVLLIPQEGKLPHINLLSQCEKVLTVLPYKRNQTQWANARTASTPGLSSQIASGIALQRLSAIFHPSLRVLEGAQT